MAADVPSAERGRDASLREQVREGACSAVMQGGGESYFSAFALHLHATPFHIGLLAALPPIVGTLAQLLSVKVIDRLHARRPLILAGAATQAAAWVPLFVLPMLFPAYGTWLLITGVMLYFATGHLTVPAWNSLITDLVHPDRRGIYFATRAKVVAISSFLALALGGLILHAAESWARPAWGFAVMFLIAGLARWLSTRYLARLEEVAPARGPDRDRGVLDFLRSRRSAMFRRFLLFSGSFHVAAMIAGPFFVVYLLRDLHFTYVEYGLWMAAPILGQLLTLKEWGRLADSYGNTKVLTLTGLAIPILPLLYLVSSTWWAVCGINFLSGMIWPGFSLCLGNYVFDVVPQEDRARGVAVYNTVNAIGTGGGALLGSWLAMVAPTHLLFAGWTIPLTSNLLLLFLASGLLRLVVSLTLLKTIRERRRVMPISHLELVRHLPVIKPVWAAMRPATTRLRWRR